MHFVTGGAIAIWWGRNFAIVSDEVKSCSLVEISNRLPAALQNGSEGALWLFCRSGEKRAEKSLEKLKNQLYEGAAAVKCSVNPYWPQNCRKVPAVQNTKD
ncbi:MAG: hypothetical protein ACXW0H_02080 [Methylobacter sp.]